MSLGNYLGAEPCLIQGLSHQHPALKSSVRPDRPEERSTIAKANALNKNDYKDFSGVEAAVNAVVRGKNLSLIHISITDQKSESLEARII